MSSRHELKAAIAKRDVARSRLAAAQRAESRALDLVRETTHRLEVCGDPVAEAAAYRAAQLSERIKAGGQTPDAVALPQDLSARVSEAASIVQQLDTAKAAHASLIVERERSDRELNKVEEQVAELATGIITSEAILEAAELAQAWNEVWFRFDRLGAITGIPNGAVRLPPDAVRLLRNIGGFDQRQFPGGRNPVAASLRECWQRWFIELSQNPEAVFSPDAKQTRREAAA